MMLPDKIAMLQEQLGYKSGMPVVDVVKKAEADLGLEAGERTIVERVDKCCEVLGIEGSAASAAAAPRPGLLL